MTRLAESERGQRARRLLADPLLQESFAAVERAIRDAWAATADDQERARERLWLMQRLLGRLKAELESVVETGRLADLELAAREARDRPS